MIFPAMGVWGCIIAVTIPTAIAASISYAFKRRLFVVAGFLAALMGLMFRSLRTAIYDDPLDDLIQTATDALPSTMLFSIFGMVVAWIMIYRVNRPAKGR